ncbi:hypothetical protein BJY01DRAFT_204574 [Aspergillus pseudoustus]|uniref:Uncharacterized protein n=1 Tax=Aspergillus pseudoustus TaxID=1810923 RepID=A0ABR4KRK7_9EURO
MSVALRFALRSLPTRLAVKSGFHRQLYRHGGELTQSQTWAHVRRSIGTKTDEATLGSPFACTWLTSTPGQITPDDILSSLPQSPPGLTPDYTPILLLTPAFAHWADQKSPFLEQWMNKFSQQTRGASVQELIYAVIAVVDRLPRSRSQNGHSTSDESAAESEGLSMLFVQNKYVQGKPAASRQVRAVEKEEPTVKFSFQRSVDPREAIHPDLHEIGLRLANTIFLNGKENTLIATRWSYDPSVKKIGLKGSVDLSLCSLTVNYTGIRKSLELPLYPVGERRKVISSMGNILRQIGKHADNKSDEPMPASSELERELPRYIDEHNIVDRRVSVWALIETSAESPYSKSRHSQSDLAQSIQAGAKLHRVMSGGGGWGKKQGLLSLDPEVSFEQSEKESILALGDLFSENAQGSTNGITPPFDPRMFMEDLSTLSQAAEPGNYVQFFASIEQDRLPSSQSQSPPSSEESISYNLGVVSDAETLPSQTEPQQDLTVVPGYFGALSEKAITYLQPVDEISETCTKIDVPGSRVALVAQ